MKRLLLAPLLIFLTSCSNDLTIKSNIGEKHIIKKSAVKRTKYTGLKRNIKFLKE